MDEKKFLKYTSSAHCSQDSCSQLTSSPLHARTLASLVSPVCLELQMITFHCNSDCGMVVLKIDLSYYTFYKIILYKFV